MAAAEAELQQPEKPPQHPFLEPAVVETRRAALGLEDGEGVSKVICWVVLGNYFAQCWPITADWGPSGP